MSDIKAALSGLIDENDEVKEALEEYLAGELGTEVAVTDLDASYGDQGEVYVAFDLPRLTEAVESCLGIYNPDGEVDGNVVIDIGDSE